MADHRGNKIDRPQSVGIPGMIFRVVFIAFVALILAAVIVQDYTDVLPLGLMNAQFERYRIFSALCLVFCLAALGVLVAEAVLSRPARSAGLAGFARMIRGALVFLVILEGLLIATDSFLEARPDINLLGGPYREIHTDSGERLILSKPNSNSRFGFRTNHPYERVVEFPRVLFLGDSYTQGSGRSEECNYPDVVERVLRSGFGRDVEVMNAGVSGYGPAEAKALLGELRHIGYTFDAVVYNFFIENDFTDNLPGTERRVVAGISLRFPESWFLRTFHPFNTRVVRWSLFARALLKLRRATDEFGPVSEGPCDLTPRPVIGVSAFLARMVENGLVGIARAASSSLAMEETVARILAMKQEADDLGVPFALVIFPDRILADSELAGELELDPDRLEPSRVLRAYLFEHLPGVTIWDTTELLRGHTGMYRLNDTHLSDAGNVVVGEWVGERLVRDGGWAQWR